MLLTVPMVLAVLLSATPTLAASRRSSAGAKADARSRRNPEEAEPAQSPNNAGIVVVVTDQSGLVMKDATVTVVNNQTGAARVVNSGADGSASFAPGA